MRNESKYICGPGKKIGTSSILIAKMLLERLNIFEFKIEELFFVNVVKYEGKKF